MGPQLARRNLWRPGKSVSTPILTTELHRRTSRWSCFVRITSAPTSFRSCANGATALGRASTLTAASRPRSSAGGCRAKSALNLEVFRRRFALVGNFFVFDDLPLIEAAEAGSLDRRDVDENIFAASLRLNKPIAFLRVEPLHGTYGHFPLPINWRHCHTPSRLRTGVMTQPSYIDAPGMDRYPVPFMRPRLSDRPEHRHRRAVLRRLEYDDNRLPDAQSVEIATDDIGHHGWAFGKRHIGNRIGLLGAARHAERVDRPLPRRLAPLNLAAVTKRADRPRVPMRPAAGGADRNDEAVFARRIPERPCLRRHDRSGNFPCCRHYSRSMISVALQWRVPTCMPVPWAKARSQFFTCTAGCASPRNCRTASITLVMPPRLDGWLLHKPPPSVLNGSLPGPEMRLPSDTNFPPAPFSQKPKSSSCISTVMVKLS